MTRSRCRVPHAMFTYIVEIWVFVNYIGGFTKILAKPRTIDDKSASKPEVKGSVTKYTAWVAAGGDGKILKIAFLGSGFE